MEEVGAKYVEFNDFTVHPPPPITTVPTQSTVVVSDNSMSSPLSARSSSARLPSVVNYATEKKQKTEDVVYIRWKAIYTTHNIVLSVLSLLVIFFNVSYFILCMIYGFYATGFVLLFQSLFSCTIVVLAIIGIVGVFLMNETCCSICAYGIVFTGLNLAGFHFISSFSFYREEAYYFGALMMVHSATVLLVMSLFSIVPFLFLKFLKQTEQQKMFNRLYDDVEEDYARRTMNLSTTSNLQGMFSSISQHQHE